MHGCTNNGRFPVMLYAAVSISDSASISPAIRTAYTEQIKEIRSGFRRIHPEIDFQISLYPESSFIDELKQRAESDLGPDLVITNTFLAQQLFEEGLTHNQAKDRDNQPRRETLEQRSIISASPSRKVASAPFSIYPQLACFNKDNLNQAPTTITELIELSDSGKRIGLSTKLIQLIWSAGSNGALPAVTAALTHQPLNPQQKSKLTDWLAWLQQANTSEGVHFLSNHSELRKALSVGDLDWISCNSSSITPLIQAMGDRLGLAALPNGTPYSASPINRQRVLALGNDSSAQQRTAALRFATYVKSPIVQQNLSRQSADFLPANPYVKQPQRNASAFEAMSQANEQSIASQPSIRQFHPYSEATQQLNILLPNLIFGQASAQETTTQLLEKLSTLNEQK